MEGTWLARTPISPDSAGMLTWTLLQYQYAVAPMRFKRLRIAGETYTSWDL